MGFDVSYVVDILKFPWPLFPKNKNSYPIGLRYEIPALVQDNNFVITLPAGKTLELLSFVFSSTGYKDGDAYSMTINNDMILDYIYTKELGQVKEIRPVRQIKPNDVLTFTFHNNTGTSKVIWIDLDMTADDVVTKQNKGNHYGQNLLSEEAFTPEKSLPYFKSSEPKHIENINTIYWKENLLFYNKQIRRPFWEGRNDILFVYGITESRFSSYGDYKNFIYQLSVDGKNNVKHSNFDKPWIMFKEEFNHLVDEDFSVLQLAEIYLTYKLKTPVSIFDSCSNLVEDFKIDFLLSYVNPELMFVLDWIDFNEVSQDKKVLGFEMSPYHILNDSNTRLHNTIKGFINIEPLSLVQDKIISRMINPREFKFVEESQSWMDAHYHYMDEENDPLIQYKLDITDPMINVVETFVHELGEAIDAYQRDKIGHRFSQYPEWLEISGWESNYFEKYTADNYPFLKLMEYHSKLVDIESPVSTYGCSSPIQDFADAFAMYCINPNCLQKVYPKKWAFMEANVKNMTV